MKQYNNEKSVISLTSWKGRINTVGMTIFSLLKSCPGFHITLVLSTDEFPNRERELPCDLQTMVNNNLFEILWVERNYKAFKKVLFTSRKYPNIPIISADDDLIYIRNYANALYNTWMGSPSSCVGLTTNTITRQDNIAIADLWGYAQLFPPHFSELIDFRLLDYIVDKGCIDDDELYNQIRIKHKINAICFLLPFDTNGYTKGNSDSAQSTSITNQRLIHTINDRQIYQAIL